MLKEVQTPPIILQIERIYDKSIKAHNGTLPLFLLISFSDYENLCVVAPEFCNTYRTCAVIATGYVIHPTFVYT